MKGIIIFIRRNSIRKLLAFLRRKWRKFSIWGNSIRNDRKGYQMNWKKYKGRKKKKSWGRRWLLYPQSLISSKADNFVARESIVWLTKQGTWRASIDKGYLTKSYLFSRKNNIGASQFANCHKTLGLVLAELSNRSKAKPKKWGWKGFFDNLPKNSK